MDQNPGSVSYMLEDLPFRSACINWVTEPKPWQAQYTQEQGVEEALVLLGCPRRNFPSSSDLF